MDNYVMIAYIVGAILYGLLLIIVAVGCFFMTVDNTWDDEGRKLVGIAVGSGFIIAAIFPFVPAVLLVALLGVILWGVGVSVREGIGLLRGLRSE